MSETNRVAIVTGGAKRVGRAIVEKLVATGFDVAFTYLTSEREARELAEKHTGRGRRVIAICADLSKPVEAADRIFETVAKEFGRLDVLVNNASVYLPSGMRDVTLDMSRTMWAVHVESPLMLCRKFEGMLRASGGRVINMVDLLAERPWPEYLVYCASKAALANLTAGLARELAPEVTVNGIAPGVVEWPADYPEAEQQKYLKRVPLGRAGTAEEVAELVHFLATGGGYLTGQIIRLDGGRSVV
jgi:pteridine reductase